MYDRAGYGTLAALRQKGKDYADAVEGAPGGAAGGSGGCGGKLQVPGRGSVVVREAKPVCQAGRPTLTRGGPSFLPISHRLPSSTVPSQPLLSRGPAGASYQLAARAKIFRRDAGRVEDLEGLKHILRCAAALNYRRGLIIGRVHA